SRPGGEGTGNCVTTSATIRLAASGWLFMGKLASKMLIAPGSRPLYCCLRQGCIMLHRLTSEMKAKCYKNVSARWRISAGDTQTDVHGTAYTCPIDTAPWV